LYRFLATAGVFFVLIYTFGQAVVILHSCLRTTYLLCHGCHFLAAVVFRL